MNISLLCLLTCCLLLPRVTCLLPVYVRHWCVIFECSSCVLLMLMLLRVKTLVIESCR